jgi:8-oxo-dGTP diphosphatase
MKTYVVGFMFDERGESVALIRKLSPEWQKGKLNGIGGKIEPGETPRQAMVREFREETGCQTFDHKWCQFAFVQGNDGNEYELTVFAAYGDLTKLRSVTDEQVVVETLPVLKGKIIPSILWMIPMGLYAMRSDVPFQAFIKHK